MLIRAGEPDDAMEVARVHVRSWQAAYRNILSDAYLDALRPEDRASKYAFGNRDAPEPHTLVATEAGRICGFATTMPCRQPDLAEYGELSALYVDPEHWGRGMGMALLLAAQARLTGMRFRVAVLWVLVGNVRAERFYGKDGWSTDGEHRIDTIWGVTVGELRYRRRLDDKSGF